MADAGGTQVGVGQFSPATRLTRSTRGTTPNGRVQDTLRSLENATAKVAERPARRSTRILGHENESEYAGDQKKTYKNGETGKAMLQRVLEVLGQMGGEIGEMKQRITEQNDTICKQSNAIKGQEGLIRELQTQMKESSDELHRENREARVELQNTQKELQDTKEELKHIRNQLEALSAAATSNQSSARASFAEVARSPPTSEPTNLRSLSMQSTPSSFSDTLYCTIDTSRVDEANKSRAQAGQIRQAIESEMRAKQGQDAWRCAAVVKDARNTDRVKIICRDEAELQQVKEVAQKTAVVGARVMRDQLYPVKVDNANRTAVLDTDGNVLAGAAEALGTENNVTIGKISWLSNKQSGKAYGSMVVYVTKGSDAKKLLDGHYFDLAGESAITNVFEPRAGPIQCFNCQEIGHKAYTCKKPRVCGKCAGLGHHHKDCRVAEPKCVPCGGPHESFSWKCRVRNPSSNA